MSLSDLIDRACPRPAYTIPERLRHVGKPEVVAAKPSTIASTYTPPIKRPDPVAVAIHAADVETASLTRAVLAAVAGAFGVSISSLCGPSRSRAITYPRFAAAQIMRANGVTSVATGNVLKRDHSTIVNATASANILATHNPEWLARRDLAANAVADWKAGCSLALKRLAHNPKQPFQVPKCEPYPRYSGQSADAARDLRKAGYSYREIADRLNIKIPTVKYLALYARTGR